MLSDGRQIAFDEVPDSFKGPDGFKFIAAETIVSERKDGKVVPRSAKKR